MSGIPNFGSTCYFSTMLQLMMSVSEHLRPTSMPAWNAFESAYAAGTVSQKQVVPLFSLLQQNKSSDFVLGRQGDTQEALVVFLEELAKLHPMLVRASYTGRLKYETMAHGCGHVSVTREPFHVLQCPSSQPTLEGCLNSFLKPETLDVNYVCDECQEVSAKVTRQCGIEFFPRVLFVGLTTAADVVAPSVLQTELSNKHYNLRSLAHHVGSVTQGGHYFATWSKGALLLDDMVTRKQRAGEAGKRVYLACYELA